MSSLPERVFAGLGWLTVIRRLATSLALLWGKNDFGQRFQGVRSNESWDDVNVSANWLGDANAANN